MQYIGYINIFHSGIIIMYYHYYLNDEREAIYYKDNQKSLFFCFCSLNQIHQAVLKFNFKSWILHLKHADEFNSSDTF